MGRHTLRTSNGFDIVHEVNCALTTGGARPPWCSPTHTQPLHVARQLVRRAAARRSEDEMARWQRGNLATTTRTRPLPLPTATVTANTSLPTCCPAARLAAGSANPAAPCHLDALAGHPSVHTALRSSTSGTDPLFVRGTITTATGWWRVNKLARHRNVHEAKPGPSRAWPGSWHLPGCQVARLQRRRCDRRCASILRASLVDLRPRQPITTRTSAGASLSHGHGLDSSM